MHDLDLGPGWCVTVCEIFQAGGDPWSCGRTQEYDGDNVIVLLMLLFC